MNDLLRGLHRDRLARQRYTESVFIVQGDAAGGKPVRVNVRERHGECLGASLWESGGFLTHFLHAYLPRLRGRLERLQVLELGCGVGLPGIYCALQGCEVTLTDQQEVLGITRENVGANGLTGQVHVAELNWGHPLPQCAQHGAYDLVIGADVLYRQEHLSALFQTLLQVTHPGNEVLIAYKQRIKSDDAFFEEAARHFDISTVWTHAEDGLQGPEKAGAGEDKGVGSGESVTGDWVSGATPCILRFRRRNTSLQHHELARANVCAERR